MDSVDYWKPIDDQAREESAMIDAGVISGVDRSSPDTDASSQGGMVGTELSPESGQMDTRATL
jgi:hypothetical protein